MEGDAADLYEAVAQAVEHDPPSDRDRGFGADALKVSRKIFAMLVDGNSSSSYRAPGSRSSWKRATERRSTQATDA